MKITFKQIGDSVLEIEKDDAGIVWLSIKDNKIPLSKRDLKNFNQTLRFLDEVQPETMTSDNFESRSYSHPVLGEINIESYRPEVVTATAISTTGTTNRITHFTNTNTNDESPF